MVHRSCYTYLMAKNMASYLMFHNFNFWFQMINFWEFCHGLHVANDRQGKKNRLNCRYF